MNKQDICFICARIKKDYCYDGIKQLGYQITIPYKDYNIIFRCMRELWYRLNLPWKSIWYNRKCKKIQAQVYIVRDSLIKPQFLVWLKKQHPDARIVLDYENLAKSTIDPDSVDDSIEKWTYDKNDAQRYSMNLKETGIGYYDCWRVEKCIPPKYDVVYVGRDKGRAEKLLDFELQLQKMGLKTYFHICPDRRFLKYKKRFYKSLLNYPQYLKLIGNTKVILNIAQANCESVTLREMEAVFHEIKCITDNKSIKNWRLYHPSRFFILGEDDLSSLPAFISSDFITASKEDFSLHVFDRLVESIYYSKKDLEN